MFQIHVFQVQDDCDWLSLPLSHNFCQELGATSFSLTGMMFQNIVRLAPLWFNVDNREVEEAMLLNPSKPAIPELM